VASARFAHGDRPVQHYAYGPNSFHVDAPKAYGIDVPAPRMPEYGQAHRDSESGASSVSSQATLLGGYSPVSHRSVAKQLPQHSAPLDRGMCEDDVFTAASILMSLRTCKMPC
ncbi:hypothetical protein GGF43_005697, partial [Coemansia sp. RSA 2618]